MTTEVSPTTRWVADEWENRCGYASAVLSGILPNAQHLDQGGYHVSIEDLVRFGNAGDYSNERALDKAPPVTATGKRYAAAVDMSMSKADMIKLYGRAMRVYSNRADPRRKYLNAINVWDGNPDHAPRRLNYQKNTNTTASKDHEWHSHEDQPRAYVDVNRNEAEAWTAARAFISMVKGETVEQWLAGEDDDMALSDADKQLLTDIRTDLRKVLTGDLAEYPNGNPENALIYWLRSAIDRNDPILRKVYPEWAPIAGPGLAQLGAQLDALKAQQAAVEAREVARDAATAKVLETVLAAAGKPWTDQQFATALAEMRKAAAEAGAAATAKLSAQIAAAARAEADALAAPAGS